MHDCLIAFGSNLGDVEAIFQQSLLRLGETRGIEILEAGCPVGTDPVGGPAGQARFLNAAIRLKTRLSAESLHQRIIEIERELGRVRGQRWGARKVDLDLLLFDELILESARLVIPHPRMTFRRFVLEPAKEIAGDLLHPIARMTISELIQHLDQTPRLIVWVTQPSLENRRLHEQMLSNKTLQGWALKLVAQFEDYELLEGDAKLVVSSGELLSQWRAGGFHGPTLILPPNESETEREIIAAALAMEPNDTKVLQSPNDISDESL